MDSDTISTIYRNVNGEQGQEEQEDLLPFHFEFKTLSNVISSCAFDKENETEIVSIWGVLKNPKFNDLISTTCDIITKNIELGDMSINCTEVNGLDSLIDSFIDSINITGIITEETSKFNISEM